MNLFRAFLLLFNIGVLAFWWWVCFRGGDVVWCRQTKEFWKGRFYTWLTPRFCRGWMWLMLVLVLIVDLVFLFAP